MIAAHDLRNLHWEVVLDGYGKDPEHVRAFRCIEHPRWVKVMVKPAAKHPYIFHLVDNEVIFTSRSEIRFLSAVARRLNAKQKVLQ